MRFSHSWIQSYFDEKIPAPDKLAEIFTFRFSEVEAIEKIGDDAILDVKILPDRACYALSHRGVAREVSALCGMPVKKSEAPTLHHLDNGLLKISVEDTKLCLHYVGTLMDGVTINSSPEWLQKRLNSIGQRSINVIVDIANFLMLDMGQPLHAFDADKVIGTLCVRVAKKGEEMTTLDEKHVLLQGDELIIADREGPLGIAGIKGGKRAAVTEKTKRLILEAALFDATHLRKISTRIGIRTDASRRFENRIPYELQAETMDRFVALIQETTKAHAVSYSDVRGEPIIEPHIVVSIDYINSILGTKLQAVDIEKIFNSLSIEFSRESGNYRLSVPTWRLDLNIPEDIAEEVGRLYGYENIEHTRLKSDLKKPHVLKSLAIANKVRLLLAEWGFSEVYTPTMVASGEVEIENPLADDKKMLRSDLTENIRTSLDFNLNNTPILGTEIVRIFEIGKVFPKNGEHTSLAIGVKAPKSLKKVNVNEEIRNVRENLIKALGLPLGTVCTIDDSGGLLLIDERAAGEINKEDGIMELNFDMLVAVMPDQEAYPKLFLRETKFKAYSPYPFIVRDIAVFVPENTEAAELEKILLKNSTELLVNHRLFDEFRKGGEKSLAFRLIFQSHERTLTDKEVNDIMKVTTVEIANKGWKVR